MELFPTRETFISIGSITIQWYAVFIIIGAFVAYWIAKKEFVKAGYDKEMASDFLASILVVGIVGARIWYVVFMFDELYKDNLWDIFKINNGGLAIQGGIVAGVLFGYWFFKKRNIYFLYAGDVIMPNLLLSQVFGRIGNFVNQEAHGGEVTLEFLQSLHLPNFIIEGMYIDGVYYHPTFLYEGIGNLIGFLIIYFVVKKYVKVQGVAFFSYFIWYGIVRFFVEGLRTDSLYWMGMRTAQLTSIGFVVFGVIGCVWAYQRYKKMEVKDV